MTAPSAASHFDPANLSLPSLAAYLPYIAGTRGETVLIIGTRGGAPHMMREYAPADFATDDACAAVAAACLESGADTVTMVIRTLSPSLAGQIAERCYGDGAIPEPLREHGRALWVYGDRFWVQCDLNVVTGAYLHAPDVLDAGHARAWALGFHAALSAAQGASPQHRPGLPDFRAIADGAHLVEHDDRPLTEWLHDTEPIAPEVAQRFAKELHLTVETSLRTAAAIDWILSSADRTAAREDLWRHLAGASSGTSRANALALTALAAWRWGDPAASEAALGALEADPAWRFAQQIAALIAIGPSLGPALTRAWGAAADDTGPATRQC